MNIGLFTESYLPHVNGVVTLIQSLKKGLESKGHTVHIFAPRVRGYTDRDRNVHRFPMFISFRFIEKLMGLELDWRIPLATIRRYSSILSELDVFHSHHMAMLGHSAAYYAKRHRIPFVFTNHTNFKEFEPILPLRGTMKYIIRAWFDGISHLCSLVISPGEKMKLQLREYGVKTEIAVIPNGIEIGNFVPPGERDVERIKEKWGIEPQDRLLIYVGRLSKEKNLPFLVESLSGLIEQQGDVKVLMVGNGPMKSALQKMVESRGLADRIIFTGYIPYEEISRYYFLSDLFVTASLSEVFPLTVIEALSSSLPAVAIDATGTGDIIRSGYNGMLVARNVGDFEEAVRALLNDEERRSQMGRNALASVSKLSVETCIEEHLALYERYTNLRKYRRLRKKRNSIKPFVGRLLLKIKHT